VLFTGAWEECPDAPACRRLVSPTVIETVGTIHAGMGFFVVVQADPEIEDARVTVLSPIEGPAILAYRDRRYASGVCHMEPYALGGGSFGVIGFSSSDDGQWPRQEIVFHGSLDDAVATPWALLSPDFLGRSSSQNMAVSPTTVALEIQLAGFVAIVEEGRTVRMDSLPGELAGVPQNLHVIGHHVIWQEWGNRVRLAHGKVDQPTSLFYGPSAPEGVDVKAFSTDGVDMAWEQQYGRRDDGGYDRVELWAAPYTDDPETLQPRKVADLDIHVSDGTVGGGVYVRGSVTPEGAVELHAYDLVDGRRRRWALPAGYETGADPFYVTATEFMLKVRGRGQNPSGAFRIDLTALQYDDPI